MKVEFTKEWCQNMAELESKTDFDASTQVERRARRASPTSRAADRAHLIELASVYGGKLRVHGVGTEVRAAWAAYCAAVDRLLPDT